LRIAGRIMLNKSTNATGPTASKAAPPSLFSGRESTDAMLNAQRAVLETYEQIGRAWLSRVQSEMELWTGLAAKLASTRSVPEAIDACQECVAQRIQMIAEDGQQLSENSQEIMNKIARPLSEWKARGPKS
jgi:Phasin protein